MSIQSHARAFTLIEIVVAIAIVAVALVGIIGLFPTALNSAADSQNETQAALIAQRIFSDLGSQRPFLQKDGAAAPSATAIPLATAGKYQLDFDEGGLLPNTPKDRIAKTTGRPVYRATITVTPDTSLPLLDGKLARVEIAIRTPIDTASKNQRTYFFVSLFNADPQALTATP
jgi:uncharacterized protein (TIGR02598 family)